jgi:hypothetical protein
MAPIYILCMIHSRHLIGRKAQSMHVRRENKGFPGVARAEQAWVRGGNTQPNCCSACRREDKVWRFPCGPLLEAPPSGMTAAGDGVEPCVTIA